MKTLKAICPVVLLALALAVPTYAGDIQTPGAPAPPPAPAPMTSADTSSLTDYFTSGDISASGCADILWALASIF